MGLPHLLVFLFLTSSLRSSRFEALDDQSLVPTSLMVNGSSEFPLGEAIADQFLGPASTVIDGSSPSSHSKADYYQKVLFCRPNYNGFKHL